MNSAKSGKVRKRRKKNMTINKKNKIKELTIYKRENNDKFFTEERMRKGRRSKLDERKNEKKD